MGYGVAVQVHHMPCPVSLRIDILSEYRRYPQMCQGIFRGKIRSCQVKIAGGEKQLHVGVLVKCVSQVHTGFGIAVFGLPVPFPGAPSQSKIFEVRLESELTTNVIVEHCSKGRADCRNSRIKTDWRRWIK